MFTQTFAIAKNAFFESIRQPIVLVLLIAATLLLMLASPLSAFTMENDQRMLLDLGLATIFMIGMFLGFIYLARNEKDSIVNIFKDVHQSNLDDIEEQEKEEAST